MRALVIFVSVLTMVLTTPVQAASICSQMAQPVSPVPPVIHSHLQNIYDFVNNGNLNKLSPEEQKVIQELENVAGPSNDQQRAAVILAHRVGQNEALGKDGIRPPGVHNYTRTQLFEKARYLVAVGYDLAERRAIMEAAVVGRWIGAVAGLLVGGPVGAASGYYLGKKLEEGKLNTGAVVTGALVGEVLGNSSVEFEDGSKMGTDMGISGALAGAAIAQAISSESEGSRGSSDPLAHASPSKPEPPILPLVVGVVLAVAAAVGLLAIGERLSDPAKSSYVNPQYSTSPSSHPPISRSRPGPVF